MLGWRSQWRLVLLNSLTCGLEICAAAGITYVPPLLLEAGMEERYMTMVLGEDSGGRPAPPASGEVVLVPISPRNGRF